MKILLINVNSHIGSTGKIVYGLYKYLIKNGDQVKLCCRGAFEPHLDDKNFVYLDSKFDCYYSAVLSYIVGYEGIFNKMATRKLIRLIESFKPDVVHLFNMPGYYINHYKLLEYLKASNVRTVYSMMDEFVYTSKCTYTLGCENFMYGCEKCPNNAKYPSSLFFDFSKIIFKRKFSIYRDFNKLTITGVEWSCEMARKSLLTKKCDIVTIPHPINYDEVFFPRDVTDLRRKLGIPDNNRVILTAVPASVSRKGGIYFMRLASLMENRSDITFVFVGYDRKDWKIPSNMITIGYLESQDLLAQYYSLADLYVCTSLADTFPTTCQNALGCGTPLLGFNAGGVPYIASKKYGTFVDVGDVKALEKVVENTPRKSQERIVDIRNYAYNLYSESVVYFQFYQVYNSGR